MEHQKKTDHKSVSGVTHAHVVGRRAGGRTRTYSSFLHAFQFGQCSVLHHLKGLLPPLIRRFKGNQFITRHLFIITLIDLRKMFGRDKTPGFVLLSVCPGFQLHWRRTQVLSKRRRLVIIARDFFKRYMLR